MSNKEYLGIEGSEAFLNASTALRSAEIAGASRGSHRCRADIIRHRGFGLPPSRCPRSQANRRYVSNPIGQTTSRFSGGWAARVHVPGCWDGTSLDMHGLLADLSNPSVVPEGAVVPLHACAHNPTGIDPNHEEWREISRSFKLQETPV